MLNSATEPVLPVPRQPPIKTISILGRISGNNETSRAAFVSAPVQTKATGCDLHTRSRVTRRDARYRLACIEGYHRQTAEREGDPHWKCKTITQFLSRSRQVPR